MPLTRDAAFLWKFRRYLQLFARLLKPSQRRCMNFWTLPTTSAEALPRVYHLTGASQDAKALLSAHSSNRVTIRPYDLRLRRCQLHSSVDRTEGYVNPRVEAP